MLPRNKYLLVHLFACLLLVHGDGHIGHSHMALMHQTMANATAEVILASYASRTSYIHIVQGASDPKIHRHHSETINHMIASLGDIASLVIQDTASVYQNDQSQAYNVLFIDGYDGFRKLFDAMRRAVVDYDGYYLLVLTEVPPDHPNVINRIFRDCWAVHLINVYVLAPIEYPTVGITMFTFFPFTETHCNQVYPVVVNHYHNGAFTAKLNVFADKFKNMHKCNLFVAMSHYLPFTTLRTDDGNRSALAGIEGMLLDVIAHSMNFSYTVLYIPSKLGSGETLLNMVRNETANLTLCSFYAISRREQTMTSTFPHLHVNLKILAPAGIPFSSLQKIAMPFSATVWLWTLVAFVVAVFFGYLRIDSTRFTSAFEAVTIFLGSPLLHVPPRKYAQLAVIVWIVATLILRNAYQGSLYQFLQNRIRVRPIDSLAQVAALNYSVYAIPVIYELLYETAPHLRPQLRMYNGGIDHFWVLQNGWLQSVYLTNTIHAAYYFNTLVHNQRDAALTISKENIMMLPVVFYMKKNSCLKAPVNKQLDRLKASGIIEHFINRYSPAISMKSHVAATPQNLTMQQIEGIVYICSVLYSLAIAVFVFEIVFSKFQLSKYIF